ncbi:DeoR/GlpR family DNA-binding transcription regulator [Hydrogenoanaerobacterium sp.]|uniref:DeoR/GlpR family DNA-binding transcription regulator n=1 Tax=Hydrogenoanaerobacterium sp. TaxID=2953763 RepID=UPI00289ECEFA|nr:DeoR/GlpR family DNA-binding transcription regulator [Hydrogenoanaerobacterium sp.]
MFSMTNPQFLVIPAERKKRILEYIKDNGSAQIKELSVSFSVSEATIRRDLSELDEEGLIERTHGGAILSSAKTIAEPAYSAKLNVQSDDEKAIAQHVSALIKDGDSVFLDSGSTTYQIAKCLTGHHNLTVVTYDLCIANTIPFHHSTSLIVTGGVKKEGDNLLTGGLTVEFIRNIHVDKAILSVDAIDLDFGVSSSDFIQAIVKKMIVGAGDQIYLVADHTKFGKAVFAKICDLKEIDLLITDSGIDEKHLQRFKQEKICYQLASSR